MGALRVLAFSDTHCGHVGALTPPEWQTNDRAFPGWRAVQRAAWERWGAMLESYGPFDAALFLADGIDGRGEKDGGAELIVNRQDRQAEMLADVLNSVPFRRNKRAWSAVLGTPYHVGKCEDWERQAYAAAGIDADMVGDTLSVEIGGVEFDLRHDIGGGSSPMGGDAALRKEALTAREWSAVHGIPMPRVFLRGHVHQCRCVADPGARWQAWTLPSLQTWTRFGARRVHGRVIHWGALIMDVADREVSCHPILTPLSDLRPHVRRVLC